MELIRGGAAPAPGQVWADLGAGIGTFTRALAVLLGPDGTVWAVDRSPDKIRALRSLELPGESTLHVLRADFDEPLDLPTLDGILMANALHFSANQERTLRRITGLLGPAGRLLLVEYDRARGNRWVPHPVPPERFRELAAAVGLSVPEVVGRRPSAYRRGMYAAVARKG